MLGATRVDIYWHPSIYLLFIGKNFYVMRVGIAQIVPTRVDESVECVCLALGRSATCGAPYLNPIAFLRQGRFALTCRKVVLQFRKYNGQLSFGHRHPSLICTLCRTFLTMDHGNRHAPKSLSRHHPVAQTILF